jgi:hypothetical protein
MNKGFNNRKSTKVDDYSTSKKAYSIIQSLVPTSIRIYDPFYCDGKCKKYMEEVFPTCSIIHEDKDAFTWVPDFDMIITNPPFSNKYYILQWLIDTGKPFACLLPMSCLLTKKFFAIRGHDEFQIIFSNERIKYEYKGEEAGRANFESVWCCYRFNLPKDVLWVTS